MAMSQNFIGAKLELDCGDLVGKFVGTVIDVTSEKITLCDAYHNDEMCNNSTITLHKSSLVNITMLDFALLDNKSSPGSDTGLDVRKEKIKQIPNTTAAYICPTNPVIPNKKKSCNVDLLSTNAESAFVAYDRYHQPANYNYSNRQNPVSSGGTNIPGTDILHDLFKFNPPSNSSPRHSKPSSNINHYYPPSHRSGSRNSKHSTFSAHPLDIQVQGEFDFEGNLALFDKKAFYAEVDGQKECVGDKPDIVRTAEPKLRHDENVITPRSKHTKVIKVPCLPPAEYTTDDGVLVPAITEELRIAVLSSAEKAGFSGIRIAEVFGRNAADFLIQQMGGAQRLRPENSHQLPQVVCVIGSGRRGLMGLSLARHLSNREIGVTLFVTTQPSKDLNAELQLFYSTGGHVVSSLSQLPWLLDYIVLATSEILTPDDPIAEWCNKNRASIATVCPTPRNPGQISCKINLQYILPVPVDASYGTVCLCEAGLARNMFKQVGVNYHNPFAHRPAVQLRLR